MEEKSTNMPISFQRFSLKTWLALFALGLALWLTVRYAGLIMELIWIVFGALLLALAIHPLAEYLARRRVPRGVTVLAVYLALLAGIVVMGGLLVPVISSEIAQLQARGPTLVQRALTQATSAPLLQRLTPSLDTAAQAAVQRMETAIPGILGAIADLGGLALDVFVALVLAYFLVTDPGLDRRLLTSWVPAPHRARVQTVLAGIRVRLTRWVWAQMAIAVYFALTFSIGLSLLGVPFALTIGIVGGVLEVIPYVGGAIALLLGLVGALTVSPITMLWVIVLYAVVVEVEAHIIAPAFYGRAMGLHPAAVLLALVAGAKAKGIVGILFAVPVTVVLLSALHEMQTALVETDTPSNESNDRDDGTS